MKALSRTIPQKEFASHPLLSRLLELHDIPKEIHIKGMLPDITIDEYGRATPRILTVVGSRKNTTYGKRVLESLIESIKDEDIIIISGLAYGIDSIAHRAALTHRIPTIAIPGSGLSRKVLYPRTHVSLAEEILQNDGVLLSEFTEDISPAPWTFPARNRIMAALSDAILIVEAEEKSGTLITARIALELGKDIGAIPGDVISSTSKGTNTLIRDGAYSILESEDLYNLLHLSYKEQNIKELLFTDEEKRLLDLLATPLQKDILLSLSAMPLHTFLTTFSELEMKGTIEETFGEVRRIV